MTTASPVVVEGTVEAANERGIKLRGDWLNMSKFKPLDLPPAGAAVRALVDVKGFLTSVHVLEQPTTETPAVLRSDRDATITRLAVLKAAANFLGLMSQAREEVRSDHVLVLADKWLAWVNSPTEAF